MLISSPAFGLPRSASRKKAKASLRALPPLTFFHSPRIVRWYPDAARRSLASFGFELSHSRSPMRGSECTDFNVASVPLRTFSSAQSNIHPTCGRED
jgi:hypothetical protein